MKFACSPKREAFVTVSTQRLWHAAALASCPGTSSTTYAGNGNDAGEDSLLLGTQQLHNLGLGERLLIPDQWHLNERCIKFGGE